MKNKENIIVFDMETTGLSPTENACIEICAQVIEGHSLEIIPEHEGGMFYSLMRPEKEHKIEQKALDVNKKKAEDLMSYPDPKLVWNQFAEWVAQWKKGYAPIPAGKNIRNFDLKFVDVLNNKYLKKSKDYKMFSNRTVIDLEDFLFYWFESSDDLPSYKMDDVRPFFGISKEGGHEAKKDVVDTTNLIIKFMKLHRELRKKVKFNAA